MYKYIITFFIILCFLCTSCSSSIYVSGKKYNQYGLINEGAVRDKCIEYDIVWGNVIWGLVLWYTIIGPIYFFGFDVMEPTSYKENCV